MKSFESFLAPQLEAYLDYRVNLGFEYHGLRSALLFFDRYLIAHQANWQSLQPAFFLTLRAQLQAQPGVVDNILPRINNFFEFLIRQDELKTNPLADVPRVADGVFIPFVFSPAKVDQLLKTLGRGLRHHPRYYLGDLGVYTAMVLIARCGLRISEPIRLKCHHFVEEDGTLYIEKTKFSKDRLIPVPASVIRALNNYRAVRKALIANDQNPHLLIDARQNHLSTGMIYRRFHPAIKAMGIVAPRRVIGDVIFGSPTVHCLRHAFAINTVKRIKEQGKSVQHALPVLAAYMGHCKYRYTGAYLKVLSANHRQGLIDFARARMGPK